MLIVQLIESGSIVIITKFDFSQLFSCVHCVVGQSVTHVLVVVTLTLLFLLGFFFVCLFFGFREYTIFFSDRLVFVLSLVLYRRKEVFLQI